MHIAVETRSLDGRATALGTAGQYTLVVDRPVDGGGGGRGFTGGQLLYVAVAGCISNDLFQEALDAGIPLIPTLSNDGGYYGLNIQALRGATRENNRHYQADLV